MVVKYTGKPCIIASELLTEAEPASNPVADLSARIEECGTRFRSQPKTPASVYAFEKEIAQILREGGRQIVEHELNRIEPAKKEELPPRIRYHKQTYRINKRTKAHIATTFGTIVLRSFLYLNDEDGEPGIHPLRLHVGIGEGNATPALVQRIAREAVERTQAETRDWLKREHGIVWSNDRLRAALKGIRDRIMPLVPAVQKQHLLTWLAQAEQSQGRNRPVLAVGRDGIMVPLWDGEHYEGSVGTVAVYDRRRQRLGTIYLGQMPETKQVTLTQSLTALVKQVLKEYSGPLPRLVYVTDKGKAQDEYYRRVLKKMKHPLHPKQTLHWEWVLDFYHVCTYIGKMAEALFGAKTKAAAKWFGKMRHWLRDRRHGASEVARSAMQHFHRRTLSKARKTAFQKAYRYLRRHRRLMDYAGYRRLGLPIGSGVTEAACKTVFTQRFKRSGMRWKVETGQVILDLRTVYLSRIWDEVFTQELESRSLPEPVLPTKFAGKTGRRQYMRSFLDRFAA